MSDSWDIHTIVNGTPGVLRPAARISEPKTGIVMEGFAAQPGMQLSSDNPAQRRARAEPYGNRYYMGFETRHLPGLAQPAGIPVYGGGAVNAV